VHCDSYAGLRALLIPPSKRSASAHSHRKRRVALSGVADAGRWSPVRQRPVGQAQAQRGLPAESVEHVAWILLRRYGVMCWRILEREAAWLPAWRDLQQVYRRLEARGEIRGGRFIAGLTGEQYALPEAIALMREVRRRPPDAKPVCLAAADPANLLGSVLAGPRIPRVAGSRVLYRDGIAIATSVAGQVDVLVALNPVERHAVTRALARETSGPLDLAISV
jgi:ATP-dependent Lhr-like helicase